MATNDNWYSLPPDMTAWNNAVIDNVSMKIPEITDYIAGIEWNKLNPATGDGDGIIQLLNGMCAAPITIRANKLAPIDIIATNYGSEPKFYPLSSTFLQKIYADNALGEPVEKGAQQSSEPGDPGYEGPGLHIKHIKTVDTVKYASVDAAKTASIEAANNLLEKIAGSEKVANWMLDNMPEVIVAISNRAAEINTKLASTSEEEDLPELMVVWKSGNSFYGNGNLITADIVNDFCKLANATIDERTGLMNGNPIVRDFREKIASIHIPSEQELVAMDMDSKDLFGDDTAAPVVLETKPHTGICITTAYMRDGTSRRGILFTGKAIDWSPIDSLYGAKKVDSLHPELNEKIVNSEEWTPEVPNDLELFICTDGYSIRENIKTDARIGISKDLITRLSTINDPSVGSVGMLFSDYGCVREFGRVSNVVTLGSKKIINFYSYITHTERQLGYDKGDVFYDVPDCILPAVSNKERTSYVSLTGVNGILTLNSDGRLVLDGESYTVVNCPFALMHKYAASYEDAEKIIAVAEKCGRCEFEALMPVEKTSATASKDDRTKNNKNTKTSTDDEPEPPEKPIDPMQGQGGNLLQTTPEAMMSVNLESDPEYGFGTGNVAQAPQQQLQGGTSAGYTSPVSSKDLENVVSINSPKVMDAYMMAGLAENGLPSQDNMMKTSDSIVKALENLSKLLFLARQGSIDFVSETDIQAAMQKLTDVLSSIGIQTQQIG